MAHLTSEQRYTISVMLEKKISQSEIATTIGRHCYCRNVLMKTMSSLSVETCHDASLLLHHLPHAAFPVLVCNSHEIDARGQRTDVDGGLRAFGLVRGHALAQHVGDFNLPQTFAYDSDGGVGGVGIDGSEGVF